MHTLLSRKSVVIAQTPTNRAENNKVTINGRKSFQNASELSRFLRTSPLLFSGVLQPSFRAEENKKRRKRAFTLLLLTFSRVAPVRFGSVTVWGWKGLIGSGFRFRRFLYKKGLSVFQYIFQGKDGSGFGSWKTVPAVPLSVSGKTVLTVPVSGFRFGS